MTPLSPNIGRAELHGRKGLVSFANITGSFAFTWALGAFSRAFGAFSRTFTFAWALGAFAIRSANTLFVGRGIFGERRVEKESQSGRGEFHGDGGRILS